MFSDRGCRRRGAVAQALSRRRWNGRGGLGRNGFGAAARRRPGWHFARWVREHRPAPARHMLVAALTMAALAVATVGGVIVFAAVGLVMDVYAQLTRDLPPASQLLTRDVFQTTQIYDRRGELLHEVYDLEGGRRTLVTLREVSPWMIDATLAAEDASFYDNPGVDARSVLRALWQNVTEKGVVSGASTITQQLVRNALLAPEERGQQTRARKLKEAILALRVSQFYSKDEILEMYLNEVYYGNLAYGVAAAAETYFGKSPAELTLAEASLIAGLPQSPSEYNPRLHMDEARNRQWYVLDQMVKHGMVSEVDAVQAWEQGVTLVDPPQEEIKAPHWVFYVRDLIEQKYGPRLLYQGGLQVYTSLDLRLQEKLEEVARNNEANLRIRNGSNTAIVAIDPKTGEILAMVGSMDFNNPAIDGQVNVATSPRQPGSSIKPIVYLTAFEKAGFTPNTVLQDVPKCFNAGAGQPPYCPVNFDNKFRGPVPVRIAL